MAHSFENVCEIILDWASEGLKKSLVEAIYQQEKEETKTESVPGDLKNTLTGTNLWTVNCLRGKFVISLFTFLFIACNIEVSL